MAKQPRPIIGYEIPESTIHDWVGDTPVRHFVMTITRSTQRHAGYNDLPPRSLVFFKVERTPRSKPVAGSLNEAIRVASELVAKNILRYRVRKTASSFNFDVRQTWLLIELDPTINWRFQTDHPAVTTKEREVPDGQPEPGLNVHLRYLYLKDGEVEVTKKPTNENCRFVLFGVVHRAPEQVQSVNLFVEFYQRRDDGEYLRTIPLIIDPDVPETGHDGFP